jgi:hypothetical protein
VFKFFLVDANGQVADPAGFVTAAPNYSVGEVFIVAFGKQFRILEIETEIDEELIAAGFNGVFVVEPVVA